MSDLTLSALRIAYDELEAANASLYQRIAGLMSKLLQEDTEKEALRVRVAELETRLEVDHIFVGEDMVRTEVPP